MNSQTFLSDRHSNVSSLQYSFFPSSTLAQSPKRAMQIHPPSTWPGLRLAHLLHHSSTRPFSRALFICMKKRVSSYACPNHFPTKGFQDPVIHFSQCIMLQLSVGFPPNPSPVFPSISQLRQPARTCSSLSGSNNLLAVLCLSVVQDTRMHHQSGH